MNPDNYLVAPMNQTALQFALLRMHALNIDREACAQWRSDGMCWALSIAWIYQILHFKAQPLDRIAQLCDLDYARRLEALQLQFHRSDIEHLSLFKQPSAEHPQGAFMVTPDVRSRRRDTEKTVRAALHLNLMKTSVDGLDDLDGQLPVEKMLELMRMRANTGIMLTISGESSAHGVACHALIDRAGQPRAHYYDPNHGEYVCDWINARPMLLAINQRWIQEGIADPLSHGHWHSFQLCRPEKST